MDITKLREAFDSAEQKNKNPQLSRITDLEKSIANYGKTWQNKQSTNSLKKTINFEKMRAAFDSNDELLQKLNEVEKSVIERSNFYSQFKTADDYDKAKREYGYSIKYQGKSYDDINKYLASDDYKTMRKDGRISDEEDTWLRNNKYQLASSKEIQVEIDDLQKFLNDYDAVKLKKDSASISNMHNEFNPQSSIMPDKSKVNAANKEFQQHYKSLGYRSETEYHKDAESKRALLEILETTKAKKKQVEDFNKKWANETEGFDKSIAVPTNDQLESALVTDDEVGFLAKAAAYSMDGSLIGGFISDKILRDEKNFDDYAALLNESEKKNIINLAKTNRVKATEYFNDLITIRLDEEYNEQIKANAAGFTSENQLFAKLGSIGSVATSLGSGIETIGNWLTGNTDRRSRLASTTTGLREGTKTHWDGTWGEDAWDFLYDTGMSAADSLAAAGLSTVVPFSGEILLGASAAANTYNDMLDRGVTGGDAILGSVAAGVAEGLFEHISIGKILDAGDITKGWTKAGLKQAAKKVGTDMLVNASEETLTEISNIVTDNLINGDLSSYAIAAEQYYMQGYSAEEAKKKAAQDLGEQVAMAGLSGALMGFGFGAGGSVVGLSRSNALNSSAGNKILKTENGLETLKTIAKQKGDAEVKTAAEKLTEESKPSEVGYVFNRLYEQSLEKSINEMTPMLTQNGATKGGINSAKGFADQIVKTALAPQSDDKRAKERTLRVNNITKDVYTGFADEGKYGADTLLQLNELTSFKPKTNEQIAEGINKDIAANRAMAEYAKPAVAEAYESNRPAFGTNELPAEVRGNLENMMAGKPSEVAQQPNEGDIQQRPAPQKAAQKKITPVGEKIVKAFGKANGVNVVFTDELVDGVANGKFDTNKTIYISRYTNNPIKVVIKHEFTHSTEKSKLYPKFQKYVFEDSKAFQTWLNNKGYASWKEAVKNEVSKYEAYKDEIKDETAKKALENANFYKIGKAEVIANFVSETLFNEDGTDINGEITENFLQELKQADRTLWQRFVDFIKSIFARMKEQDANNKDIIKLEQKFLRLVETSRQERAKGEQGETEQGKYMFSGSRDAENLYDTPDNLKPQSEEEWSYFNRQFANKTNNLKNGQKDDIMITTENNVYFVRCNGYLSGKIILKEIIDGNEEFIKAFEKEFINGAISNSKELNSIIQSIRNEQRPSNRNDVNVEKSSKSKVNDGMDKKTYVSNDRTSNIKSGKPIQKEQLTKTDSLDGSVYSLPDLDANYLKAVESGDMETAQRLVDEAAKKSGYWIKGHHGTDIRFTVFDREKTNTANDFGQGFYFSSSEFEAEQYQKDDAFGDTYNKIDGIAYDNALERIRDMGEDTNDDALFTKIYNEEFDKELKRRTDEGVVINAYLKMENPFIVSTEKWITEEEAIDIAKNTMYADDVPDDIAISDWVHSIKSYAKQHDGKVDTNHFANNMGHSINLTNALLHQGKYDGILDYSVGKKFKTLSDYHAIALYPNKIKDSAPVTYDDNGNVIPLSKRFNKEETDIRYSLPDIPDTAKGKSKDELSAMVERGEITPTQALNALADQFGAMPKGENPKVDVVVPSRVSKDKHVMQWVRTAAESGHLDDGMLDDQRKQILKGALSYQVISDKAAVSKADDAIRKDFAGAVKRWEDIVNSGKQMTKFDIALGERLLQQAAENGQASDVMKYTAELAELGTRMGQNIQALRLLKKMTGIGKLYYIQRTVNSLNKDIEQKYKGKKQPVKIDADLAKLLANSKNAAEMEAVENDMLKDIADQMPSTFLDKWNAWRYLAMLGNPRTHIRNVLGNAVFVPAIRIKDGLSYAGERFVSKEKRTKVLGLLKPEYREFARNDFKEIKEILTGGGKMNPSDKIRDQQKIFKTKALEILRNKNTAAMEAEDSIFLQLHYVRALGSVLQARGVDLKNVTEEQLTSARLYALKEAKKATYRDDSAVAEALNRFQYSNSKSVRAFGMLVEGILPFKKTPINILKRGVEYSPAGLLSSLSKGVYDLKKGKITADEFIDGISAGLTGTGVLLLGMLLQSFGLIVGGLDYEDEDALERMSGAQPYAIEIGDVSYTIDWMAPAVLPFLVGAEVQKFLDSDEERDPIGFAVDALTAIGEPLTELSMLSGLNDAIESVAYSDNKLTDMLTSAATSYLSQAMPTALGQVARTFDDTRRINYIDKNSSVPKGIQTVYQKTLGKIPGLENTKVPYIDAWGRTEVNDSALLRTFENFVSPGYVSTIKDDKVNNELAKIYTETGESGVIPKRASNSIQVDGVTKNLTADEYVQYATDKGQYSRQYVEGLINHPIYETLDEDSKAEIISDLYSYANAKAKSNVSDYDYTTVTTYKTAAKLEKAGIDPVSYYIALNATSTENADTDGSGTVTKKEKQKALRNAGFNSKDINTIININKKK